MLFVSKINAYFEKAFQICRPKICSWRMMLWEYRSALTIAIDAGHELRSICKTDLRDRARMSQNEGNTLSGLLRMNDMHEADVFTWGLAPAICDINFGREYENGSANFRNYQKPEFWSESENELPVMYYWVKWTVFTAGIRNMITC